MTKKDAQLGVAGVIAFAIATAYLIALLDVERQNLIIALLAAGIAVVSRSMVWRPRQRERILCRS
jgi:hypothetical protein